MIDSVNSLVTQGMTRFKGPSQCRVVHWPTVRTSAARTAARMWSKIRRLSTRASHSSCSAQQIFGGDHVEDRSDVLRHPAVNQDQAAGERLRERSSTCRVHWLRWRRVGAVQEMVGRQQTAPAHAPFGISCCCGDALDQLDAGKDSSRVLPAPAGAS